MMVPFLGRPWLGILVKDVPRYRAPTDRFSTLFKTQRRPTPSSVSPDGIKPHNGDPRRRAARPAVRVSKNIVRFHA